MAKQPAIQLENMQNASSSSHTVRTVRALRYSACARDVVGRTNNLINHACKNASSNNVPVTLLSRECLYSDIWSWILSLLYYLLLTYTVSTNLISSFLLSNSARRTPLHVSCGKRELHQCTVVLIEQGAHIMAMDVLGIRPCDLNQVRSY